MPESPTHLRFGHGLGDHVYFAHLLSWYGQRSHRFSLSTEHNKAAIYRCCGNVQLSREGGEFQKVAWNHGPDVKQVSEANGVSANKAMANLSVHPLPDIGPPSWEAWEELTALKLDLTPFVLPEEGTPIQSRLQGIPRPLVLFHPKGNTLQHSKDLSDEEIQGICEGFGKSSPGTLLILDWDCRVAIPAHPRIHAIENLFGKRLNLPELIALYDRADLLIGIDSGPAHLARMTPNLPVLFLWQRHHPFAFALPRANDLHLISNALRRDTPDKLLSAFDVVEFDDARLPTEPILTLALERAGHRRPMRHSVNSTQTVPERDAPRRTNMKPDLALYSYGSNNIGDDMQSLVLRRWLGYREDEILFYDRDRHTFRGEPRSDSIQLLINGFIGQGALPIPETLEHDIHPVFLAIHMADVNHDNPGKLNQLRKYAPVGCRDKQALRECAKFGVPAYFAGCLTILCEPADLSQDIDILLVDINPRRLPALPERRVIRYSSNMNVPRETSFEVRREMCLRRWELLSRSRLVVTSKLHAAMPAIGMGRPVIFIREEIVCSGRLTAFPENFRTYPECSRFSWDPDHHRIDTSAHQKRVESSLMERIGHHRKGHGSPTEARDHAGR
jgi:hypothetical protein